MGLFILCFLYFQLSAHAYKLGSGSFLVLSIAAANKRSLFLYQNYAFRFQNDTRVQLHILLTVEEMATTLQEIKNK